jgi:hypothetical protein
VSFRPFDGAQAGNVEEGTEELSSLALFRHQLRVCIDGSTLTPYPPTPPLSIGGVVSSPGTK